MARHPNHQRKPLNRRSIRMKGYDYSSEGLYFITICCYEHKRYFGQIQKGVMCLNRFASIVWEEWLKTSIIRPNIALLEFIVMPNHIHGIIHIKEPGGENQEENIGKFQSPSHTIGAVIRGFKGATTRRIREALRQPRPERGLTSNQMDPIDLTKSIWKRDYWDIIIRDEKALHNITNYIRNNPIKWHSDKFKK